YFLLHDSPSPNVTLGENGHIFLNGVDARRRNWFFDAACLSAHLPRRIRQLENDLSRWQKVARRRGLRADVVIIPTSATIYGDELPDSVPQSYREACALRSAGNAPLLDARGPSSVGFSYPLREMLAARADPAFYPRGNWHPTGLSL